MSGQYQIIRHFPHFFQTGDRENLFYRFVAVFGAMLETGEEDLVAMMRSHWVDTADNEGSKGFDTLQKGDLDKIFALYLEALGGTSLLRQSGRRLGAEGLEDDALYRQRMKGLINVLREGASTLHGVREIIAANLGIFGNSAAANVARESIVITEYLPQEYTTKTYHLKLFEPFVVKNYNVEDTPITINLKAKNPLPGNFELKELKIINVTSGQFAMRAGTLPNDDEGDNGENMILPSGTSLWRIEGIVGQFFKSTYLDANHQFGSAVFAPSGPVIEVSMTYTRFRPASFGIQIPWDIPHFSELLDQQADNPRLQIHDIVKRVKAAGVWTELVYQKTFTEDWAIVDNFSTETEDQVLQDSQGMGDDLYFGGVFNVTRYNESVFNEDQNVSNENQDVLTEYYNNMIETQSIRGRLQIRVVNQNGDTVDERRINNKITLSGKYMVAQLFSGNKDANSVGFFGVGIGAGVTQDTMTDLEQPVQTLKTQLRKALSKSPKVEAELDEQGRPTGRIKVVLIGELDSDEPHNLSTVTLTEAGLFTTNKTGKTIIGDGPSRDPGDLISDQPPRGVIITPEGGGGRVTGRGREIRNTVISSERQKDRIELRAATGPTAVSTVAEIESGTMYNRVVFKPITKTPDFKLQLIWEVIF